MIDATVHWLFPREDTLETIRGSHLASLRLRAGIAGTAVQREGGSVTFGEHLPRSPDIVVVPKIGSDNIKTRSHKWIELIDEAKSTGAKIVIDYTDHHLGFDSPMRGFYSDALRRADHIVVPSAAMQQNLGVVVNIRSSIIRDAIEYSIQAPRRRPSKKARLIWFGHSSNLKFLLSFLSSHDLRKGCEELVIVTSIEAINWISRHHQELLLPNTRLIPWSRESLAQAALDSDLALLPGGIFDPSKSGASSNRLITALTLGLPVVTHSLLSYRDYREFYTDIDSDDCDAVINAPWTDHPKVLRAQATVVPRYMPDQVGREWTSFLSNLIA